MMKVHYAIIALAFTAAACSAPAPVSETSSPQPPASVVPADVAAVVSAAAAGITITNGELDSANNEYEVTGTMPGGDEIEFDLVRPNGAWAVLEIQRDVAWASVPAPVRAAAAAAPNPFEPVRVIESKQPADGSVVYELFAAPNQNGAPSGGPALEVRWHDGKAELVPR